LLERMFVNEGISRSKLNAFLKRELRKAGYVGVTIQKTPVTTRVAIKVERPGLVIGRKGCAIRALTQTIENRFELENVQIKVEEVPIPELDAAVMARRIASSLERGINFRRVLHWSLEKIMKAGALGAELVVSGKLVGKGGKSRSERVSAGYMEKAGESSKLVDVSQAQAIKKAGIIGVTVRIVPPSVVFPDKVDIRKATAKKEEERLAMAKKEEEKRVEPKKEEVKEKVPVKVEKPVKAAEPKPVVKKEEPVKVEPKKEEKPVKAEEPKPVVKKEEPAKAEPKKEEKPAEKKEEKPKPAPKEEVKKDVNTKGSTDKTDGQKGA